MMFYAKMTRQTVGEEAVLSAILDSRAIKGITKKDFNYRELSVLAQKAKKITDAVHSTLQLTELDCASCKMTPVCDEVEGLRELHFKKEKEMN